MRTLVLGGVRSGKSLWAEHAIAESAGPDEPVRYVATGPKEDSAPSWATRIAAHRDRRPGHWQNIETGDVATLLRTEPATATLVDDVGGWLTATLDRNAWAYVAEDVNELVDAVKDFGSPLALVSPEVGLSVVATTASGRRFADELGALNQRLAAICERVVLVVAGQPMVVKDADDSR